MFSIRCLFFVVLWSLFLLININCHKNQKPISFEFNKNNNIDLSHENTFRNQPVHKINSRMKIPIALGNINKGLIRDEEIGNNTIKKAFLKKTKANTLFSNEITNDGPFRITFFGNPPDEFRNTIYYVCDLLGDLIYNIHIPISISISWTSLDDGVLGSAGPSYIYLSEEYNKYYCDAIANQFAGYDLDESTYDIIVRINKNFDDWNLNHLNTESETNNKYDLATVCLHELLHGMGFFGLIQDNGNYFIDSNGERIYIYDDFILDNNLQKIISPETINNHNYISEKTTNPYETFFFNQDTILYSPSNFNSGSSLSHLDEDIYKVNNENSLMTPQLKKGERIYYPGSKVINILQYIGWEMRNCSSYGSNCNTCNNAHCYWCNGECTSNDICEGIILEQEYMCNECISNDECDDITDMCTLGYCNGEGKCIYEPRDCNDNDECTMDVCLSDTGCVYYNLNICHVEDFCSIIFGQFNINYQRENDILNKYYPSTFNEYFRYNNTQTYTNENINILIDTLEDNYNNYNINIKDVLIDINIINSTTNILNQNAYIRLYFDYSSIIDQELIDNNLYLQNDNIIVIFEGYFNDLKNTNIEDQYNIIFCSLKNKPLYYDNDDYYINRDDNNNQEHCNYIPSYIMNNIFRNSNILSFLNLSLILESNNNDIELEDVIINIKYSNYTNNNSNLEYFSDNNCILCKSNVLEGGDILDNSFLPLEIEWIFGRDILISGDSFIYQEFGIISPERLEFTWDNNIKPILTRINDILYDDETYIFNVEVSNFNLITMGNIHGSTGLWEARANVINNCNNQISNVILRSDANSCSYGVAEIMLKLCISISFNRLETYTPYSNNNYNLINKFIWNSTFPLQLFYNSNLKWSQIDNTHRIIYFS